MARVCPPEKNAQWYLCKEAGEELTREPSAQTKGRIASREAKSCLPTLQSSN
ncbi:MAG: hypothetical protein GY845_36960 [Planctomycetes bacterium]|nr:hypothetical protein [Planctomycetota bacterium]